MMIELTSEEERRLDALAERQADAQVRGTAKKDRRRVMLLRAIEAGIRALEAEVRP